MNRRWKLLLICSLVLVLVACQSSGDRDITVGMAIYRYDDNFMSFVKKSIEENSKDEFVLRINDSENSQIIQNEQIKAMTSKGVDALAINMVDITKASEVISIAKKAKLPLLFFNREPSSQDMDSYDKCWYVGTDSKEAGIIQGEMIIESWQSHPEWDKNGDEIIQYVLLKGEEGHPDAEMRTKYVIETIQNAGIKVEEIELISANWDSLQAKKIMDSWIATHGENIEYVIANNDAMALGALASLQSAGYFSTDNYMPIVGVDALPEILSKIEQGLVVGSVLNDSMNQSKAIVALVKNIAQGKNPVEGTSWILDDSKSVRIPYISITKENIELAWDIYK